MKLLYEKLRLIKFFIFSRFSVYSTSGSFTSSPHAFARAEGPYNVRTYP